MKQNKRQLRLWQLLWMTVLLAMVLGVTALAADAEETKTEYTDSGTVYSDISDSELCRTPEAAASATRSNLEERSGGFNVYYLSETAVTQEDAESWLEDAYSETGSATEGDYLRLSVVGQLIYVTSETTTEGTPYYQVRYIPKYTDTIEQEAELSEKLSKVMDEFEFQEDTSDYDKVKAIYDYICKNVKYDYTHLEDRNYLLKHSAYAALVNNSAVCQGYSALLYRMLKTAGIECRCIRGTDSSGGGHDWNIVNLDGYWYNMDATWDATLTQNNQAYQYFLTGGEIFLDHIRDSKYQTEEFCNAYPIHQTGYAKYAGTYGDLTWELSVLGVLTIKGNGPMEDGSLTPWKDYKEEITQICIQSGITSASNKK